MKTNKELINHLNNLKILQTSSWDENIPEEIWHEYFECTYNEVAAGLNIDEHRWYELSTTVIRINSGFMGIRSVTKCFSEQSSIDDMCHKLEFYEMEEINVISYKIKS